MLLALARLHAPAGRLALRQLILVVEVAGRQFQRRDQLIQRRAVTAGQAGGDQQQMTDVLGLALT